MLDLLHPYLLDAVATSALHQTKTLLLHSSLLFPPLLILDVDFPLKPLVDIEPQNHLVRCRHMRLLGYSNIEQRFG